jgi:hypothetical protein
MMYGGTVQSRLPGWFRKAIHDFSIMDDRTVLLYTTETTLPNHSCQTGESGGMRFRYR